MRLFCSICKEIFIPYSEVKVTNCGHLYHGSCISKWTKKHKTCPQCRSNLQSHPFRVFFDFEKDNDTDSSTLEHQVETLSDKLRESEAEIKNLRQEKESCEKLMVGMRECASSLKLKNDLLKTSLKALKEQVSQLLKQNKEINRLEDEVELWKNRTFNLKRIEIILEGSSEEVNKLLQNTAVSELSVKQLCTYVGILKTQFHKCEAKNIKLVKRNKELMRTLSDEQKKNSTKSDKIVGHLNTSLKDEIQCIKTLEEGCLKKQMDKENQHEISVKSTFQKPKITENNKTFSFNINIDLMENDLEDEFTDNKNNKINKSENFSKTISYWEDFVSAGPSRNFTRSSNKASVLNNTFSKDTSSGSNYAFDGLGGRKKIRLGGATPRDVFEKIKRNEENLSSSSSSSLKHKKIIDYYKTN